MDTQTSTHNIYLIISLAFFTVLLLLFIVSLYRLLDYRIRSYKQRLQREIEWVDKERGRLSADLHDEVGSNLATIAILLQRIDSVNFEENQQRMIHLLDTQRQKLKEIVYGWAPPLLHSQGLELALVDLLEDMRALHTGKLNYEVRLNNKNLDMVPSMHLFLIVKEVLTNILKHAGAGLIRFKAYYSTKWLMVEIENDGKRFSWPAGRLTVAGNGLQNIKNRAEVIDTAIDISYSKQGLTIWKIQVPIKKMLAKDV